MKSIKNKRGFTLVELMVVVAILGVLTMVAIPVFNKSTKNAEKQTCRANLKTIDEMISLAMADGSVTNETSADQVKTILQATDKGAKKYLKEWPQCPASKSDDDYSIEGTYPDFHAVCKNHETEHKLG